MIATAHSPSRLGLAGLKILALVIGYSLWYIFSQSQIISVNINAPLVFDTANESRIINAPETISVSIATSRQLVNTIDFDSLAVHFNVDSLKPGENTITLASKNLFLPEHVNLIHYEPSPLKITINDQPKVDPEQQGAHA